MKIHLCYTNNFSYPVCTFPLSQIHQPYVMCKWTLNCKHTDLLSRLPPSIPVLENCHGSKILCWLVWIEKQDHKDSRCEKKFVGLKNLFSRDTNNSQ